MIPTFPNNMIPDAYMAMLARAGVEINPSVHRHGLGQAFRPPEAGELYQPKAGAEPVLIPDTHWVVVPIDENEVYYSAIQSDLCPDRGLNPDVLQPADLIELEQLKREYALTVDGDKMRWVHAAIKRF